jgi:hypothetical protein
MQATKQPRGGKCPRGYIKINRLSLTDGRVGSSDECRLARQYWLVKERPSADFVPVHEWNDYEFAKAQADDYAWHAHQDGRDAGLFLWDSATRRKVYTGQVHKHARKVADKARKQADRATAEAERREREAAAAEAAYYAQFKREPEGTS